MPVEAGSYMARECGATTKYAALGSQRTKVPNEVYAHLNFKVRNFKGGYFALKSEEEGKIIKVSSLDISSRSYQRYHEIHK